MAKRFFEQTAPHDRHSRLCSCYRCERDDSNPVGKVVDPAYLNGALPIKPQSRREKQRERPLSNEELMHSVARLRGRFTAP